MFDFEGVPDDGLVDALRESETVVRAAQARQFAVIAEIRARAGSWIVAGGERFVSAVDVAAAEIGRCCRCPGTPRPTGSHWPRPSPAGCRAPWPRSGPPSWT
ncbi:MAG: hypothetical protein ACR2KO_12055 [Geodermatophilaceae bacterium]